MRLQVNLGLMYVRTSLWDTFLKLNVKYAIRNCKEDISITMNVLTNWLTCVQSSFSSLTSNASSKNMWAERQYKWSYDIKQSGTNLTFKLVIVGVHFSQPFLSDSASRLVFVHSKQRFDHLHHFILGFMPHSCTSINPGNGIGISVLKAVLIILQVKNGRVFSNVMACMISDSVEQQRLI